MNPRSSDSAIQCRDTAVLAWLNQWVYTAVLLYVVDSYTMLHVYEYNLSFSTHFSCSLCYILDDLNQAVVRLKLADEKTESDELESAIDSILVALQRQDGKTSRLLKAILRGAGGGGRADTIFATFEFSPNFP